MSPSEFVAHQKLLDRYFNIVVEPPVDFWPESVDGPLVPRHAGLQQRAPDRQERVPYISYRWPRQTLVRDFSRIVPVSAKFEDAIAHIGTSCVGIKQRVGKGTLIVLGSPLGPILRAHDPEAQSWLQSVTKL